MTLVIAYVDARRGAYIASDRRLTLSDGQLLDDTTNKCVVYDGRVAFAFTGLAQFDGAETSAWLAETLADAGEVGLDVALDYVADAATAALRRPWVRRVPSAFRELTVVGAGWSHTPSGLVAVLVKISNRDGAGSLGRDFDASARVCRPDASRSALDLAGCPITDRNREALVAGVRQVRRHGSDHSRMAAHLVARIRQANEADDRVGRRVLTATMPKASVQSATGPRLLLLGDESTPEEVPSFRYWEDGHWNGVSYGPTFVLPGGPIVSGFESGPIRPQVGGLERHETSPGFRINYPIALLQLPNGDPLVLHRSDGVNAVVVYCTEDLLARALAERYVGATPVFAEHTFDLYTMLQDLIEVAPFPIGGIAIDPDVETLEPAETLSMEAIAEKSRERSETEASMDSPED